MASSFGASAAEQAVVGMGNPYCTDDGVGVGVVRALGPREDAEVWESLQGGAYLALSIVRFTRVLIVDAAPFLPPGELRLMPLSALEATGGERRGPHGMSLTRALEMMRAVTGAPQAASHHVCDAMSDAGSYRAADCRIPEVWALAIGIPPDPPFGEGLSPRVAAAVPSAVQEVRGWLSR